jgi:hypothetical protein
MSGPEFFQTRMGQTFYDGTMRRIADALGRIATALEAQPPYTGRSVTEQPSGTAWPEIAPLPPALAERQEAWHALIGEMVEALHDNLTAWEDEEDSVQVEHMAVIVQTREVLAKLAGTNPLKPKEPK